MLPVILIGLATAVVLWPAWILNLLGFSIIGPLAGSLAAFVQSLIGNVVAGSLFALLQSVAMGGLLKLGIAGLAIALIRVLPAYMVAIVIGVLYLSLFSD